MKNTFLVTISNRGATRNTARLWRAICASGAMHLEQTGSPDIAFARNQSLSATCDAFRKYDLADVALLCDDDMIGPLDSVQKLIDLARETGRPCSVVYATQDAHLAGARWKVDGVVQRTEAGRTLWLVGMGLVAIPRKCLLETEAKTASYKVRETVLSEFCTTGAVDGEWIAEDYSFCKRLGGVLLQPIGFGHIKQTPLWPDQETLDLIDRDETLPGEADSDMKHVAWHDQLFPGEDAPTTHSRAVEPPPAPAALEQAPADG